ncbi:DUF2306 domain-containing protein [Halobacterium jilantaiense]|uniref:DUF2306 domain-containing protein n=1 Tax=Halobacterium jilantaiense TaxID=355548 RepID=A0A1I0P4D6_9EURY|nr:hypothetical protein [Halobacterium jilantaiense]SEW08904.1 hypothetical protein SAMN04487945_1373 [Halobacterium jilantaiense]
MEAVETAALWTHVAAGVLALIAGGLALATEKGGRRHVRVGRVYVGSMAVVVATVVPLFAVDPTTFRAFLLLVAVFSGYFVLSGYRALARKRPGDGPTAVDWAGSGAVLAACLALGVWGVCLLADGDSFGVVMAVFGTIGALVGAADLRAFRADTDGPWLVSHLSRMVAGYIATVTAVAVVNAGPVPDVLAWLSPTVVGVPLIWYWQAVYGDAGPLAGRV